MTIRARIDVDVVFHDFDDSSLSVGSLSEHAALSPTVAAATTASVGTASVAIVGSTPLNTLVVKNTGANALRLGDSINLTAGRVAVIPTTATITVSAPAGSGTYSCLWVG